jgi:hypothetical protein
MRRQLQIQGKTSMYINYDAAPGELSINQDAASRVFGVVDFVDSLIMGEASSTLTKGLRDVLLDGEAWNCMCRKHGLHLTLSAIGDLHDLLDVNKRP